MIFVFECIYTRSNKTCINGDDESSFLHPPRGDCRNNVRFPSLEKSGDCTFKCASSVTHYDSYENLSHFPYDIDLSHSE